MSLPPVSLSNIFPPKKKSNQILILTFHDVFLYPTIIIGIGNQTFDLKRRSAFCYMVSRGLNWLIGVRVAILSFKLLFLLQHTKICCCVDKGLMELQRG